MDAFAVQLSQRLPLALTLIELVDFAFDESWLDDMYDTHRGRCYDDVLESGGPLAVRRITLRRDEDDVILFTDLMDEAAYPAGQLLALYRHRWGIENVFQEVTEIFALKHLIGSSPPAVLFQFSWCLLMYNLVRVIKAFVALDGMVKLAVVSAFGLFYDIKRELMVWSYLEAGPWRRQGRGVEQMRARLSELLRGSWDPVAYTKASDKKPRKKRIRQPLPGGHTSVQRLLEQAEKGR